MTYLSTAARPDSKQGRTEVSMGGVRSENIHGHGYDSTPREGVTTPGTASGRAGRVRRLTRAAAVIAAQPGSHQLTRGHIKGPIHFVSVRACA